jgi:hypothetical protein
MALTVHSIPGRKRKFVRTKPRWMKNVNMELNEEERREMEKRSGCSTRLLPGQPRKFCIRGRGEGFFSSPKFQTCSGDQPPSYSIDIGGFTQE